MICKKCNRVKLRAEEEITVMVDISSSNVINGVWGHAIEDSKREHVCQLKYPMAITRTGEDMI